jgi:hypothetical protein
MAITRVGSPAADQSSGMYPDFYTPPRSQVPTPGNLLLLSYSGYQAALPATPTGWTLEFRDTFYNDFAVYSRIAAGGANDAPVINVGNPMVACSIWEEYAGVDATTPIHARAATDGTHPGQTDITVTKADSFIWSSGHAANNGASAWTWAGSGTTQSGGLQAYNGAGSGYQHMSTGVSQPSAAGSYSVFWSLKTPAVSEFLLGSIALNPAGPAGPEYRTQAGLVIPTTQAGPVALVSQ